jgi:hypothetical protein
MASSTNLTARVTGGVFGVAVLGARLSAGGGQGFTRGLHAALIAAAVALAGTALSAALIPGRPPAGGPPRG